jgi:hypothetical protein
VKAPDACAATLLAGVDPALGLCRQGHVNLNGTCQRQGDCGKSGQRPCLIGERTPSCHEGLKENFRKNVCEPLRPGESPLLAGVASLAGFYGDGVRAVCRQTLGDLRIPATTQLAMSANASKDVLVGASCEWLAGKLGASQADTAHMLLDAGPRAKEFEQAVARAYEGRSCAAFAEKLSPASFHGRGHGPLGTDCRPGQFWDPNGNCYSCPKNYSRTLHPVQSPQACVDKPGGELARSACSVFGAIDKMMAGGVKCTIEILQSGVFTERQLDFASASREVCFSTGAFAYSMLDVIGQLSKKPEEKTKKLQEGLRAYLAAIKDSPVYRNAKTAGQVLGATASGAEVASKIQSLQHCR